MVGELLFNLAALVAFCVLSTFLLDHWPLGRTRSLWMQGALFGLIAAAGMAFPVRLQSGVIFDGRSVVLCLAAWHFGWRAALLSSLIAILYRLGLGGTGALTGAGVVLCTSGIGLAFRKWVNPEQKDPGLHHLILLGFTVHLVMLVLLQLTFEGEDLRFFTRVVVPPLLSAYPLATILAGRILSDSQSKMRAHRQMALNERMIRSLFDESPLVMLILDPDNGRILDVSNKAVDFYGYPKEKLVSLTLKDLQISPPVEMREMFNLTPSIQKGFHRLQHRLADGSTREVEICSGTVHFEQREVELMFVVDITRQIRSIERTRASLREREDILQTAMDGFWIVDEHSIIREVNSAYCSLSGYLPEELVDEKLGKFDCRKETHSLYFESGPYGEASRFETQHRTKDGQILDLEVSVRKSTTQENRVYVFFRDVTADKAAKDRMQMLSACLAATENTVVISDPEQRIEWVNDAFCRISGYRKDEAYGKATAEIFKPGQESHAAAERMKQARQRGDAWRGELTNLRKDGTPYTVDATLTPLKNERDEVIRYIGILQDITEKKKLERLYLRSQRMETVGSLTSGIAHDLNNILSPILMSAEMLTISVTNPEHAKLADIIFKSADRGGELLKQLLGFARGTSAEKQILPIGPLVKETFKMYRETFPKNIDMQISLSADLPSVAVNPGQISQVLGNVIVNARDAMPGGGSLFLEVSMEEVGPEWAAARPYARAGSFIRIRIQDTGSGIAPEYQDKIFEPFFTTKPSGKGTGLGLATCLNIVKGHNGFIDLTSSEEQGTKVDLFLPVSDAPPQRQTTNPMKAASAYRSGKGRHLVVVDDEKAVRTIVSTALETMDYTLHPFSSGQEALDFLSKHPEVDLVLLDVEMPGMNGKEVVWEMDRRRLEIPVLFITGLKEESNEPQIDFRGRPVLMKPFTLDELRKAVETHLKSKTT